MGRPLRKTLTAFRIDDGLMEMLRAHKVATGVPMGRTLDRALRAWLGARTTETERALAEKRAREKAGA